MEDNWKLRHVGIPVRDLDASVRDYKSLGLASFGPEFLIDSSKFAEYLVYGKIPDPAVRTRAVLGQVGPLGVELLQPIEGNTVHRELLESTGEGIGHVAYGVDDLEGEVAKMLDRGFPIILSITPTGRTQRHAVYFDTRGKFSNLIVELIQEG